METKPEMSRDAQLLSRKLAEAEARITSRLIVSAQQSLPPQYAEAFVKQFQDNSSLDMLEMERTIAANAKLISDALQDLYKSVVEFHSAKQAFDEWEKGFSPEANPQELHDDMIRRQEKMFSLASEYEIKENISRRLI